MGVVSTGWCSRCQVTAESETDPRNADAARGRQRIGGHHRIVGHVTDPNTPVCKPMQHFTPVFESGLASHPSVTDSPAVSPRSSESL